MTLMAHEVCESTSKIESNLFLTMDSPEQSKTDLADKNFNCSSFANQSNLNQPIGFFIKDNTSYQVVEHDYEKIYLPGIRRKAYKLYAEKILPPDLIHVHH